ncbi:MAG TPA: undecaprenyl-phosphate glucose phosphotransferase, partial [Flavobacterium sp.]
MVAAQTGRYSKYIRPISIAFDLGVITLLSFYFFRELNLNMRHYLLYQTAAWFLISYFTKFYGVYRFTTPVEIFSKLMRQCAIFLLIVIAFFPFSKQSIFSGKAIAYFLITTVCLITLLKFLLFYYLKKYRIVTGSNYRTAIIIGYTPESIKLKELFMTRNDFG